MGPMYYIGLDAHKQKISYCVKDVGGKIHTEGWIPATRFDQEPQRSARKSRFAGRKKIYELAVDAGGKFEIPAIPRGRYTIVLQRGTEGE